MSAKFDKLQAMVMRMMKAQIDALVKGVSVDSGLPKWVLLCWWLLYKQLNCEAQRRNNNYENTTQRTRIARASLVPIYDYHRGFSIKEPLVGDDVGLGL